MPRCSMEYRRFGRTELRMPVMTCGGMRHQASWTRDAAISAASQRNVDATVDRAFCLGINHFETAHGYGTSEQQLGPALARVPRDRLILQTKVQPTLDPRVFEENLLDSFRRLRVQTIDLFAFHGLNTRESLEHTLRQGGCFEVAARFRREGRIRHIGFSTHAPTPLIVEAIDTGRFDYVNLHFYYIFQDNHPALLAARRQDMGVFIISPSDKGGRLYRPSPKLLDLCAPLSPMVFNNLWCLSHPEVHTLSIGAARPSDFDEHLKMLPLLGDAVSIIAPVAQRLDAAIRTAVGDDFAARWRDGLREWDTLPGQINVRRIVWLYNIARAYDMLEFAQERYAAMSPDDHWVPGARAENFDERALAAALPDWPFRDRTGPLLRAAHAMLHDPNVVPVP